MNKFYETLLLLNCKPRDIGQYWRIAAIYRGGKNPNSVSISKKTGYFKDFVTNENGPFEKLMKLIGADVSNIKFDEFDHYTFKDKIKVNTIYPKEILKRLVPHYDFFLNRGIKKEVLELFEAGLAHSGKLNKRIVFPVYDKLGRIIAFNGRWHAEKPYGDCPKWKIIGRKTEFLYPNHLNSDIIKESGQIILVESIGDVLALWNAGIKTGTVLFGTQMSNKLLTYIVGLQPSSIVIALNNEPDNDSIGNNAALKIEKKLLKFFNPEKIKICLPTLKDFGLQTCYQTKVWAKENNIVF